jgi:HEAT repeat protein
VANVLQSANANLKPILPDLIQLWQNEKDQAIKFGLLQSFARVGKDERLTPILLKILKEGDYNSKIGVISVLGQLHEEAALPELFNLLQTTDDNTRNTVICALNNFHTPQVFEEILKVWKKETTPWLKAQTISILASFQDKRFLTELAELVKTDKNPQILSNIAYVLPNFRTDPLVSSISVILLRTGDANIRAAALNAIRANNDRSVIPELINMLESENDFNSFTTLLDALQGITAQKFFPQQIPREMKDNILKSCKDWWTKNK